MTDATLIQRFLKGDVQAFNTLVWRWEKPLYNFILRTMQNPEIAKDLTQMTFIRMYKQLKKLNDHDKFKSWAYRIAVNLCRDELKKKNRHRVLSLDSLSGDSQDNKIRQQFQDHETPCPEYLMQQEQIRHILKEALQRIPEEQRVVIIMKQYQGLKFKEIADALNEPVNTVKSRMYYGLRAMKKYLEESNLSREVLLHEMQ